MQPFDFNTLVMG